MTGTPPWTKEERFSTFSGRKEYELELDKLVEEWTINFTPQEVMTRLQGAGVPAGIVETNEDLFLDPQLQHRNHFWTTDHIEMGQIPGLGQTAITSTTQVNSPAPCIGEHNQYVFNDILGLSDEEFVELLNQGVLE